MIQFRLDKSSATPFYRQLVDLLLAGISAGAIRPGDRLPTIRDLAVRLEINPNTVVKAYTQLELLGVLDTQQGSGVYVRPGAAESAPQEKKQRAVRELCLDFVGRAQLLNISIDVLLGCLAAMKAKAKETNP